MTPYAKNRQVPAVTCNNKTNLSPIFKPIQFKTKKNSDNCGN